MLTGGVAPQDVVRVEVSSSTVSSFRNRVAIPNQGVAFGPTATNYGPWSGDPAVLAAIAQAIIPPEVLDTGWTTH